jgi:hypothetical protein
MSSTSQTFSSADACIKEANITLKENNPSLPSMTKMAELGEYIKTYLMLRNIAVSYETKERGRLTVQFLRRNADGTELVHRVAIRSLAEGTTIFEVLHSEQGDVPIFTNDMDTEKVFNIWSNLDAMLMNIYGAYFPRSTLSATSSNSLSEEAMVNLEEKNFTLPSIIKMEVLGEYIKSYMIKSYFKSHSINQVLIKINGKTSFINVSYESKERGLLSVQFFRRNADDIELVHRLTIRSLLNGTTEFEVLRGEKGCMPVYFKSIDTEKVHNETKDLDDMLKHIWEIYYPRQMVTATSSALVFFSKEAITEMKSQRDRLASEDVSLVAAVNEAEELLEQLKKQRDANRGCLQHLNSLIGATSSRRASAIMKS